MYCLYILHLYTNICMYIYIYNTYMYVKIMDDTRSVHIMQISISQVFQVVHFFLNGPKMDEIPPTNSYSIVILPTIDPHLPWRSTGPQTYKARCHGGLREQGLGIPPSSSHGPFWDGFGPLDGRKIQFFPTSKNKGRKP